MKEMKRDNILKFELKKKGKNERKKRKERINSAIKVQKEQESKHQGTQPKAIVYSN